MKIEALPVTSTLGAEIRGLDLSKPLPEDTASAVLNALFEHRVIFFRGQDITPAQHVAFSAQLGPVFSDFPPYLTTLDGQPEVTVLDGGSADSASFWHSDVSGSTEPPMASILVMREADAVLEYLFHHQQQADFQCRWRWQQGDIAIWDNRAVHHYAIGDYAGMQRTIHRTTLEGDAPY